MALYKNAMYKMLYTLRTQSLRIHPWIATVYTMYEQAKCNINIKYQTSKHTKRHH